MAKGANFIASLNVLAMLLDGLAKDSEVAYSLQLFSFQKGKGSLTGIKHLVNAISGLAPQEKLPNPDYLRRTLTTLTPDMFGLNRYR